MEREILFRGEKLKPMLTIYKQMPKGWNVLEGATTAPIGYVWVCNGKSSFSGNYKHGLLTRGCGLSNLKGLIGNGKK